jgi:hypothetical protein
MTHEEIYNESITELDSHIIKSNAIKDNETPLGFVLTYLKDNYSLTKIESYPIATKIVSHFNL